jgi:hypothetical protein
MELKFHHQLYLQTYFHYTTQLITEQKWKQGFGGKARKNERTHPGRPRSRWKFITETDPREIGWYGLDPSSSG